jgi:hypothetical protein
VGVREINGLDRGFAGEGLLAGVEAQVELEEDIA